MAANGVWTTSVKSSGRRYFEAPTQCRRRRIFSVRSLSTTSFWIITSNCLSTSSSSPFSASAFNSSQLQPQLVSHVLSCFPPSSSSSPKKTAVNLSTKLYVSGLSFRTTEESLRNAFLNFGQLIEVNLVMDRIANRPRGFAFLRYATEEESKKAIEGMHGKVLCEQFYSFIVNNGSLIDNGWFMFLDGRVIFVEVAKPRSQLRQSSQQHSN